MMHHRPHIWFATLWRWHKINGNFDDHNDAEMGCNQCVTNLVPGWLQPRQATLHLNGGMGALISHLLSHLTSSTAQTWSQHPDYNTIISPTQRQGHKLRRIDGLFEVMATFGIKLMGRVERSLHAPPFFRLMQGWSCDRQSAKIHTSVPALNPSLIYLLCITS